MAEIVPEIQRAIKRVTGDDVYLILVVLLVGGASFGLGRLSAVEHAREPVQVHRAAEMNASQSAAAAVGAKESTSGQYVASKNSDKYHYPWCSGASRIKEENKIWFQSTTEARQAGYSPAANCEGLQ